MGNGKMTDIALAQMRARSLQPAPPELQINYGFDTVIEPNAAAKARIVAQIEEAKAAGIIPPDDFDLAPEDQDIVVYKMFTVTTAKTPGGLAIPGGQLAQARIRGEEFDRTPLLSLKQRADAQFRGMFGG
jgi:hypothetical protein